MQKMHGNSHRVRFECDGTVVAEGARPFPGMPDGLVVHGVHYDVLGYESLTDDHGPIDVGQVQPSADDGSDLPTVD